MNISKYLSVGLVALMGAAFAACDGKDEPDYSPASKPAESQRVFFAKQKISEIVAADQTSVEVPLYRSEESAESELTVQLTTTDESGLFGVPETATFAANSTVAQIPVRFNTANLTPNSPYAIQIAVDEANADVYGLTTLDLSINYEVMSEWALFGYDATLGRDGQGVWTLGTPFSGTLPVRVFERHIPSNPDQQQFVVQCYMPEGDPASEPTPMGDPNWLQVFEMSSANGGQNISVPLHAAPAAIFGDGMVFGDGNSVMPNRFPNSSSWDAVGGTFTLNLMWGDDEGYWSPADNYVVLNGYADTKEYSVTITEAGAVNAGGVDYSLIDFQFNSNVNFIEYVAIAGELDEAQIAAIVEKIENGEQEGVQTLESTGTQALNFPRTGTFTIVAVGYNISVAGEVAPKTSASLTFDYVNNDPDSDWTVINDHALFTEEFLGALGLPASEYEVTVQQHLDFPELIRIRNPYANWPYLAAVAGQLDLTDDFAAFEFDATDPNAVVMPLGYSGLFFAGNGPIFVGSYDGAGKLANKVISFEPLTEEGKYSFVISLDGRTPAAPANFGMKLDYSDAAPAAAPRKAPAASKLGVLALPQGVRPAKMAPKAAKFHAKAYGTKMGRITRMNIARR